MTLYFLDIPILIDSPKATVYMLQFMIDIYRVHPI
jgi:hypothetical protein